MKVRFHPAIISFFYFFVVFPLCEPIAVAQTEEIPNEDCFSCHSDTELTKQGPGGEPVSLFVDEARYAISVHADNACVSCHADITEIPHPETLEKVDCGECHSDAQDQFLSSSHGKALMRNSPDAPSCATCHGSHEILSVSDVKSKTHKLNQIEICTSCHLKPGVAKKFKLPPGDEIQAYKESIHGRGVLESGLLFSATCVNCHSAHNVRPKTDPESLTYWSKIPETCGECHLGILEAFKTSEHGALWQKRSPMGPGCLTCHGAHSIQDPVTAEFQTDIPKICAECHEKEAPTYQDTFHGQALSLGFLRSASCADCHTAHQNLKAGNPQSTVHKANLIKTCGKCHEDANASFVTFDPHMDPTNKEENALFYYIYKAMVLLLIVVFGFFGIHTLLWLQRSIVASMRGEFDEHKNGNGPWIRRFGTSVKVIHAFIIVSFLGLAFTGLPLKFHYSPFFVKTVSWFGGVEVYTFLHRVFAIITFGYAFYYLGSIVYRKFLKKEKGLFWGPGSMVPRLKDIQDLYHQVRWFLYIRKRPADVGRWSYWEKFDYFAVFWGIPIIGTSGLILWFPAFFTSFLPGYVLNIAKIVHSEEALLAVGFIFIMHFFHTHLRPEAFPMDLVIFTGSMPLKRFQHERPEEYLRLKESGQLESRFVEPPGKQLVRLSFIVGGISLLIGIGLIVAILAAVIVA